MRGSVGRSSRVGSIQFEASSPHVSHTHRHRNNAYDATQYPNQTQKVMSIRDPAAITAETGISSVPLTLTQGPYDSALLQETTNLSSRAYMSVNFFPPGAFNGLLFKDFVLGGLEGSYTFYLLREAPTAPSFKIYVTSMSTLQETIFVWTPGKQQGQIPVNNQWTTYTFDETSGEEQRPREA